MSKKPLKVDISNLKIEQLGYVFKDVEKQAKIMETIYGMPKFAIMEDRDNIMTYRGKESKVSLKLAISRFNDLQIELIQVLEGESIYKEFIDSGREGLQHLSYFIEDLDSYIEAFKKAGFQMINYGHLGRQRYAYFDTEDSFGIILEFQETIKRKRKK
ncbi:MAG: hypothetical protein EU539_04080 [Promethearchaeota archaeon]|nr:MAG: hypothetical protein EU539_04080 [Candidatus Lokiarchaeota archaeon]